MNARRIISLAFGLCLVTAGAAQAQPYWGFPIPLPGNAGTITIPFPGGRGYYARNPYVMPAPGRMIPYPGNYRNGGMMFPGAVPGMSIPFPGSGNGGYASRMPRRSQPEESEVTSQGGVEGYEILSYQGAPCRVPTENLPLLLTVNNRRYLQTTEQAITVWNRVGSNLIGKPFFEIVQESTPGSVPIEWESPDLPRGAAGVTMLRKGRGRVQVDGIAVKPMNVPQGNLCEVITHELGHALGLDHSDAPQDIMYRSTHTHVLDSGEDVRLTQRDLAQLRWLYTQPQTVPIVASR